jgi:predicted SAM-dependent methyltransferase
LEEQELALLYGARLSNSIPMTNRFLTRVRRKLTREASFLRRRFKPPALPVRADDKRLVHIGCGQIDSPDFINIDAVAFGHVHFVTDNLTDLGMFEDNSVDLIYMCHILEHIPRVDLGDTLLELKRVLKRGGVLRLSVPDFDTLLAIYRASDNDVTAIVDPLMGAHSNRYDVHYGVFNARFLTDVLTRAGFASVRTWDPRSCDHHDFEDWASRIVPHLGKDYSLSLNLEAVR